MTMNRFNTINKQILCGALDADAESRATQGGASVVNLRVVTYGEFRDQGTQEVKDFAEYHRVAVWGKAAESLRGLKKGTVVYVEGRTRTRKFTPQGETQARYYTEIQVGIDGRCFAVATAGEESAPPTNARPRPTESAPAASQAGKDPASAWDEDENPPY